jgi:hypothetical protein
VAEALGHFGAPHGGELMLAYLLAPSATRSVWNACRCTRVVPIAAGTIDKRSYLQRFPDSAA